MEIVQPTSMPNDIVERKTGRPRIYTDKEIKESVEWQELPMSPFQEFPPD